MCIRDSSIIARLADADGRQVTDTYMTESYFPLAGSFAIISFFEQFFYIFGTSISAGFRLPLRQGLPILALGFAYRVIFQLWFPSRVSTFWASEHCPMFYHDTGTKTQSTAGSDFLVLFLMVYNIWLEERLARRSLGE